MVEIAVIIALLPLLAFVIQIFFGKRLPRQGDWVSIGAIVSGFGLSLYLFIQMLTRYDPGFVITESFTWIDLGSFKINLGIYLDNVSITMLMVVTIVSSLVHIYSMAYMEGDPRYSRFYAYLSLFSFSMLGLIIWDNLFGIYMMWELVGLCSYLLIGFWFEKDSASNAAKKAFITNRIGDFGFLFGLLIVVTAIGSFTLTDIAEGVASGKLSGGWLTAAGILLFCGAIGKSAQFPLHVWLPDAMEGPTPVSALIHAATMVAAGVYLVARLFFMLSLDAMIFISYIGAFTAIFASIIAVTQNDIKRVLAYSTVSQLGYMIMALGAGSFTAGFFHLVTHAMFKAGLFLGSGSVIHAMHHAMHKLDVHDDPNDIRLMGGFKDKMPTTYRTFLIYTLALSGIPFFSGFLSKDAILGGTLAFAVSQSNPIHYLLPVFGFAAAILTAFYMFRLVILTFHGEPQRKDLYENIHESPKTITIPLSILAVLSIFIFYTLPGINPFSAAHGWFEHLMAAPASAVAQFSGHPVVDISEHTAHSSHTLAMIISIIVALSGILTAFAIYYWKKMDVEALTEKMGVLYRLSYNKFYVDEIYEATVVRGLLMWNNLLSWFDNAIIDGLVNLTAWITRHTSALSGKFDNAVIDGMVNEIADITQGFGRQLRRVQTGQIQTYIFAAVVGAVVIILVRLV